MTGRRPVPDVKVRIERCCGWMRPSASACHSQHQAQDIAPRRAQSYANPDLRTTRYRIREHDIDPDRRQYKPEKSEEAEQRHIKTRLSCRRELLPN